MEEIWKDIEGYDGFYKISNTGKVSAQDRTVRGKNGVRNRRKPVLLKPTLWNGYYRLNLCKDGKIKTVRVHRLLAAAFIPNPEGKPYINHIDGNRSNNSLTNLEWCTQKENMQHAINVLKRTHHLFERKKGSASSLAKPVIAILPDGSTIEYGSILEAAQRHNVSRDAIGKVVNGVHKTSRKIIFKFKTQFDE